MELGACHECASGSNLAFHVDFCSQIHRVRIFCGGQALFSSNVFANVRSCPRISLTPALLPRQLARVDKNGPVSLRVAGSVLLSRLTQCPTLHRP
jgi:hypothetical protein